MILVLNEWVFHDLWGENGGANQNQTKNFLMSFRDSSDWLVVPAHGKNRWLGKVYELMGRSQLDPSLRIASRLFRSLIEDSGKIVWVQLDDVDDVPQNLLARLPEEDIYLVEAYLSASADMLVTTDRGLHDSLAASALVFCRMRDDFLAEYL